jgi:tetratricopeptide (TPR) repeat protein
VWHFRPYDCLEKGLRAIELAGRVGDDQTEIDARRSVIWALMASGDREQTRVHTRSGFALAERVRDRWSLASAGFDSARLFVYEGDWDAAREMSDVGEQAQSRDPRALAMRALVEYELGNFEIGATYRARLREVTRAFGPPGPIAEHALMAGAVSLTARIARSDEHLDAAAESASALLTLPRLVPAMAMVARAALALIAVQRNDAEAAEEQYGFIEQQKNTACFIVPLTFDRLLGLLAVTLGRVDDALVHFEDGLALCERAGYRPEYAWTAYEYANALVARGRPDDAEKAVVVRKAGLAVARELGMRPLIDRILGPSESQAADLRRQHAVDSGT